MDYLLASHDVGRHRVKAAAERKDMWVSKQIEEIDENDVDVGAPGDLQEAERANLENADASVRAAILGKSSARILPNDPWRQSLKFTHRLNRPKRKLATALFRTQSLAASTYDSRGLNEHHRRKDTLKMRILA